MFVLEHVRSRDGAQDQENAPMSRAQTPPSAREKGSGEFGHNPRARERNLSATMRLQL